MNHRIIPALLLALVGCQDDASPDPSSASTGTDALYACEESDFQEILPPTGPGVAADGTLSIEDGDYILHTTLLIAREGAEGEVLQRSLAIVEAARGIDGFVAVAAARSERCGFLRTYGIWRDEAAMYALLATDAHSAAVADTTELSVTGKTTFFSGSASDTRAFDWQAARASLRDVAPSAVYEGR